MVTFPPEADEGTVNFLRRLAMQNGYAGWRHLARAAGINPTRNALLKNQKQLSKVLGLDAKWLEKLLKEGKEGAGLHDPFYQRTLIDTICPECLKEQEYVRLSWSHCFVNACPMHRCELIDACPSCGTTLHNSRQGIAYCDCGYDLRYSQETPATTAQVWISARLSGDMRPYPAVEEIGKPEDYRNLSKLLFQLAVRYEPEVKVRPEKVSRPKTIAESLTFLEPVSTMLECWRSRFAAHIEERFRAGKATAYSLSGRLGPWYNNLHKLCHKPVAFGLVWEVFSDAVFDHFDGVLRGQNGLRPSAGKKRSYFSLPEAAKAIGVSAPTLKNAISNQSITAQVSRPGTNYRVVMISRLEVERVQEARSRWLPESAAADYLGVTESVLQRLVSAGVIENDTNWRSSFLKAGPIPAGPLPELISRLSGFVQKQQIQETLTFNQLTARRTVDTKALTSLYQAIYRGEIRAVGHDKEHKLGGLVFSLADVKKHLGSVALSNALTLTQLEKATGWKYEAISNWVNSGYLESEQVPIQGAITRVVTVASIASFRQKWIPISELAHAVRSKSSAVTKKLEAKGIAIVGQTEPNKGARRGGLLRIRDLAVAAGLQPKGSE